MKLISRISVLKYIALAGFAVLGLGMFRTQVVMGPEYRERSENNRIRLIRLEAPRGNIYDRNGVLLATSRVAYNVHVIPEDLSPEDLPTLTRLLKLTDEEIAKRMSAVRHASFTPVLLKQDISKEDAMKLEEQRPRLGGIFIQQQGIRSYPQKELGAHLVGYIGKISSEEYNRLDRSIYHFNSWIGRNGMERVYDKALRGEDGGRQLEVNARGVPIQLLGEKKPRRGEDVYLTFDAKLDSRFRKVLGDRQGAILVMDLKTGEMTSTLSAPSFDPNAFVMSGRNAERIELIGSQERPLFDRGLKGLYPPGSIFKLVTAMAALENKTITPHTTFNCPGYFRFGPNSRKFKCWFHEGHGRVDLYTAIERSCNVYFYQVGRLIGNKRIAEYARKIGFGSQIALDLSTSSGLVPDEVWKEKRYQDKWYPGETISFAIGQSYLLVSPIQVLKLVATIATDGLAPPPTLVKSIGAKKDTGEEAWVEAPHDNEQVFWKSPELKVKRETYRTLRQGMARAVASDRGTAQLARVNFGKLAAKTGTAQAPPGEPHAWFGGFYPIQDPKVAVVVFVERGVSGGMTAAKIAKQVIKTWNELNVAKTI